MTDNAPDTSTEAVERLACDMQKNTPWGRGAATLRALAAERDDQKKARLEAVRCWIEAEGDVMRLREALLRIKKGVTAEADPDTGELIECWMSIEEMREIACAALQEKDHD